MAEIILLFWSLDAGSLVFNKEAAGYIIEIIYIKH